MAKVFGQIAGRDTEKPKTKLVLNLRVEFESGTSVIDDFEEITEIVEQARGYGSVSGFIEVDGKNIGEVS